MGSSSLTRERTRAPCIGSMEPYPLDHQGSPFLALFEWRTSFCHLEVLGVRGEAPVGARSWHPACLVPAVIPGPHLASLDLTIASPGAYETL